MLALHRKVRMEAQISVWGLELRSSGGSRKDAHIARLYRSLLFYTDLL